MFIRTAKGIHLLKVNLTKILRNVHNERKVNVNGVNINIVEAGVGEKSVLLLPGAMGSAWTDFKPQIEELPTLLPNHKFIIWDPVGYGKSIPPKRKWGDYFRNDAESAINLMKTLNISKFSIMGWSDGGVTGLVIAGRYQEYIDKLVIWGSGAYSIEEEIKAVLAIRDVNVWSPKMREPMEKLYGKERFAELLCEWVDAFVAYYTERDGDICRKEVQQITAPIFILYGRKDPILRLEQVEHLRGHFKEHRYHEFPDGKHNIHLRYPNEFNKLVSEFLSEKS